MTCHELDRHAVCMCWRGKERGRRGEEGEAGRGKE